MPPPSLATAGDSLAGDLPWGASTSFGRDSSFPVAETTPTAAATSTMALTAATATHAGSVPPARCRQLGRLDAGIGVRTHRLHRRPPGRPF